MQVKRTHDIYSLLDKILKELDKKSLNNTTKDLAEVLETRRIIKTILQQELLIPLPIPEEYVVTGKKWKKNSWNNREIL